MPKDSTRMPSMVKSSLFTSVKVTVTSSPARVNSSTDVVSVTAKSGLTVIFFSAVSRTMTSLGLKRPSPVTVTFVSPGSSARIMYRVEVELSVAIELSTVGAASSISVSTSVSKSRSSLKSSISSASKL